MTQQQRSRAMSRVRGTETKIECTVRSLLHQKGYRFRKNVANLPGHPDIVLPKHNVVIFVHGCFWHGHSGCNKSKLPATRTEFWQKKIGRTVERDHEKNNELVALGWRVAVVWECSLKNRDNTANAIIQLSDWIASDRKWLEAPKK